ncbi:hypothetical protein I2494_19450 [Budviciaceae bacterium BWR-B9]|uniref:Phage neck terminator protein gp12-like domain-containing protein n=1 Tax=Limnobaculum allomyrinae TaxID=2791986 RepID=A0ABS1IVZ9_9GAMM|nr:MULTISPECIES: hypothetical protein [Limnobaculum]MBK5145847.1 hypothetical protein [Limnobaculum allomyrinae]MBV7693855.1 hypothetical protein [Limnobaculum sp. M2-1]
MSNDSTSAGYLTPTGIEPTYDEALEREISRWIRGVTGLEVNKVFPRWTETQPKIPNSGVTWCEFGITAIPQDYSPAHVQNDSEHSEQWSHESISVICCFYGPSGQRTATLFRDGMAVAQNNEELNVTAGLTLLECGRIISVPELINNTWVRRYDITVTLRRKTIREYNIKSLVDSPVKIFGE